MIPKRWVEAYLRLLLRNRLAVALVVAVMTVFFAFEATHLKVVPQFLDFYPGPSTVRVLGHEWTWRQGHPYINIYHAFRRMFGSANVLTVILEVKQGDIYNPATLQKLDVITKRLIETKGVVPYQVMSIAHPKMKASARMGCDRIRRSSAGVPQTPDDAQRVKFSVYSTKGIRGLYVAQDDTAALVNAGFWEEELDFDYLHARITQLAREVEDANHTVYVTGFPWLYTSIQRYIARGAEVFVIPSPPSPSSSGTTSHLDGHLGADLLGPALGHLGARLRPARAEPGPAGPGGAHLLDRPRALALGAVDGPLPRGVPPPRRQARGDRRELLHLFPPAIASVLSDEHRHPAGRDRSHPAHPEGRGVLELLDHLDPRERGDAAPSSCR
jgi:hypothetical protein